MQRVRTAAVQQVMRVHDEAAIDALELIPARAHRFPERGTRRRRDRIRPTDRQRMPALNKLLAKPIAPVGAKVANSSDETRRAAKPIAEHTTEPFFDRN
jgi:hypothetical protein